MVEASKRSLETMKTMKGDCALCSCKKVQGSYIKLLREAVFGLKGVKKERRDSHERANSAWCARPLNYMNALYCMRELSNREVYNRRERQIKPLGMLQREKILLRLL